MTTLLKDFKHVILYGLILAVLTFLLKWLQWKFLIVDNAIDIYVGLIAVFFTGLGVWMATQLAGKKVVIIEEEVSITTSFESNIDENELRN